MGKGNRKYTPDRITTLKPNEVFVFGSNLEGHHDGGAARYAWDNFGAIYGQGVGMQGQSYAIPTMQGGPASIKPYVDSFIDYAKNHRDQIFYVTRVGCGIAGLKPKDIAPLFKDALTVENIILPKDFLEVIDVSQPKNDAKSRILNNKGKYNRKFTPERITTLKPNEVFVFGSNLEGHHDAGAAHYALDHFDAIYGKGVGIQGQSYAIPTMQGGPETIKPYVDNFIDYAKKHQNQIFYVTRIGCGIARLNPADIVPLFKDALTVENIILPKDFVEVIEVSQPENDAKSRILNNKGKYNRRFTPERITTLRSNEVFVFGSNLEGRQDGGAARYALENFGAIYGKGVGMQGQSYAIPTMQGGPETIKPYVDSFIDYAKKHQNQIFYVTRIGCGVAGLKPKDIAPLFKDALTVENIILPKDFVEVIDVSQPENDAKSGISSESPKKSSKPTKAKTTKVKGGTLIWAYNNRTTVEATKDLIKEGYNPVLVWQFPFILDLEEDNGILYSSEIPVVPFRSREDGESTPIKTIIINAICYNEENCVKEKIRNILRVALENGHDSVVFGTMGWETSGISSKDMARLFHEVFEEPEFKDRFRKICFAIDPSCLGENLGLDIAQSYINEFPHTGYFVDGYENGIRFEEECTPAIRVEKTENGKYKISAIKELIFIDSAYREFPPYFTKDFDEVILVGKGRYELCELTSRWGIDFYLLLAVKDNDGWRLIRVIDQSALLALESLTYYPTLVELLEAFNLSGRIDYFQQALHSYPLKLTTSNSIIYLRERNVFVFGSNINGYHNGGAALFAQEYFGAKEGQGKGLQGQSYAIPTVNQTLAQIKQHVDEFLEFAKSEERLFFWVTPIGCKNAGHKESEIAPLFKEALKMNNVVLPQSFVDILTKGS